MPTSSQETRDSGWQSAVELAIWAGLAAGFGALIGWLVLSYFVRHIAEICQWDYLAAEANWITPLVFGGLSGLNSVAKNRTRMQRRHQRQALGSRLGLQHTDRAGDELTDAIDDLLGGQVLSVSNCLQRQWGSAEVVVADVTVGNDRPGSTSRASEQTRTVVYVQDAAVRFPGFQVIPVDGLTRWLRQWVGFRSLDLARHPDFAQHYQVQTRAAAAVDRFFDSELLTQLAADPRWQIHTDGHRAILWQPGCSNSMSHDSSYLDEALGVVQALRTRALVWQTAEARMDPSERPAGEGGESDSKSGLEHWLDCHRVTAQDVETLLQQSAPRRDLPHSLRRQKFGFPIIPFVGFMFGVGGTIFTIAAWIEEIQVKNGQEWLLGWLGGLMTLLGFSMLCGACYYRWWWGQLLIHGHVAPAIVRAVQRTEVKIDNRRRYLVTVEYQATGQTLTRQLPVYGRVSEVAQTALENHQPVRVLYAPRCPSRATIAEGLVG